MPSIASHFAIAKLVSDKINVDKKEFYKGNILPDVIDLKDSHYKIQGKYYLIPDIEFYKHNVDLSKDINKGYLCHLLLDKYFLEDYVLENVSDYDKMNIFSPELMYNDYTNMNYLIVQKYNLDVDFINESMQEIDDKLLEEKFKLNEDCINSKIVGDLRFIDLDKYYEFLNSCVERIINELR